MFSNADPLKKLAENLEKWKKKQNKKYPSTFWDWLEKDFHNFPPWALEAATMTTTTPQRHDSRFVLTKQTHVKQSKNRSFSLWACGLIVHNLSSVFRPHMHVCIYLYITYKSIHPCRLRRAEKIKCQPGGKSISFAVICELLPNTMTMVSSFNIFPKVQYQ